LAELEIVTKLKERIDKAKTEKAVSESKLNELKTELKEITGSDNAKDATKVMDKLKTKHEETKILLDAKIRKLQDECPWA